MKTNTTRRKAFSLFEIIFVAAVVAFISAIVVTAFTRAQIRNQAIRSFADNETEYESILGAIPGSAMRTDAYLGDDWVARVEFIFLWRIKPGEGPRDAGRGKIVDGKIIEVDGKPFEYPDQTPAPAQTNESETDFVPSDVAMFDIYN